MKKTIIFYILCLITVFVFFRALLFVNRPKPYIAPIYNSMNVILDTQTTKPTDVIININGKYSEISKSRNMINKKIEGKAKTLEILINKDFKNKIKNIVIFNDIKVHYFKDFSNFEKEEIELCPNNECSKYTKYKVPDSVKYNKNASTYNYRSHINTICSIILIFLSGHFVFYIPYIFLFISIIYFINNQEEIKRPKFNPYFYTVLIFVFGILSYSNNLFDYFPWGDEFRTLDYSDPKKPFSAVFNDGGNPPLFYILFRCFLAIFGISQSTMRLFPLIFAILFSFVFWIFLKKKFNIKIANVGLFLAFINVPLTYFAQEARSYSLQMLLTPVIVYFLFKVLKESKNRDFIIYGILIALVVNVHYYEVLFLFSNFIFGMLFFIYKKRYKDILKFTLSNVIGGLFFLPFFIYAAFNKAFMDSSFTVWIPKADYIQVKKCIYYLFGGSFSLLISFFIFFRNLFGKEKNLTLIYSFFAIVSTVFLAVFLSNIMIPILVERYLVLLIPLFIIFICSAISVSNKNKFAVVFFIIWVLLIQSSSFEKANRKKGTIEMPLSYSKQYYDSNQNKNIYVISNLSNPEYIENKEKYIDNNINYIGTDNFTAKDEIKNILDKNKNALIFTSIFKPTSKNNYKCYFNSASDMCLWRIEND